MKKLQFVFTLILSLLVFSANAAVKINHWQTATGARVYFVENHDLPIVDVSVSFPAGSSRDTAATSGLAGITRYMMTLGAAGMDEEVITNQFADIGAQLGGDFDMDKAGFKLRTLTSEQGKALDTFQKILHHPDFPSAVLAREKTRIISGLRESETQPESISNKAFMKALYGTHPYSLDDSGEVDTVSQIKTEDLRQFYQTYYSAKSAVIALIGDMTESQAHAIADSISAGLPQTPAFSKIMPVESLVRASVMNISHPATQAHILLGQPGIKRGDPDYFPLYVGNYILGGGGFVSRLTEEVREKRGLVYSVYSYFMPMSENGPFQIGLQTKKEQANDALKLVNETVATFVSKGVTEKELRAAKDNIIGGFPMRIDSNSKILDYLGVIGFYQLPLTYLDDFNREINKVTVPQINDAFKRRVNPANFATVIVGADSNTQSK
ncbi:MAG TPA: peptidase M16 [Methylophilaceae bacterium]|nr:peptidase M16 [Methylophilaceae bacterium]HAJ71449.1 peptidase M16 [Methylophilaceae bacterium]